MSIEKVILPKERLFYVALNTAGDPLYIRTLDPLEQGRREQYLRTIETSFLREDVARIEVWSVRGGNGQVYAVETFTDSHKDLHFASCMYEDCGHRVFTEGRYARCGQCQKLKCTDHGKFHHQSGRSLCLDCYQSLGEQ